MVLGNYVPHIIDDHIVGALQPLLAREPALEALPYTSIQHWAIHPGGRSILDKVQSRLGLSDQQLVPAREVLRNYGNMSSATVLFVLKHILDQDNGISDTQASGNQPADSGAGDQRICSMAFGPGLTVETALFTKLPKVPRASNTAAQREARYEPAEAPVS
jgi:predicted naringenin-chalcone synthase